jgi:hypothetical protein
MANRRIAGGGTVPIRRRFPYVGLQGPGAASDSIPRRRVALRLPSIEDMFPMSLNRSSAPCVSRLACAVVLLAMTAAVAQAQDTDQAMAAKLGGYISCINEHSNWVMQSRDRYYSWLKSPQKGPSGREDIVYGLYELRDPASCRKEIARAAALPPDDTTLEQAASDYLATLEAAAAVVAEANSYYELENWKDDGMRQGKAMHPRLVAAFDAFDGANDRLYAAVIALKDAASERFLARLAADPALRADYVAERLLFDAKRLLDRADGLGDETFDRAAFATAVQDYESAWNEYAAFRKANPQHASDLIRSSTVSSAAFELLKVAKTAQRRERDGFRFDEGERMLIEANAPQMVDGHPAKLIEQYNQLITWSNSAR